MINKHVRKHVRLARHGFDVLCHEAVYQVVKVRPDDKAASRCHEDAAARLVHFPGAVFDQIPKPVHYGLGHRRGNVKVLRIDALAAFLVDFAGIDVRHGKQFAERMPLARGAV